MGEGEGEGGTIWVGSFFMESNGALHWEMMKKVEQQQEARSLHELAYYLGASNKQNFNVFFFVYCPPPMDQLVVERHWENWYNSFMFLEIKKIAHEHLGK